MDTKSLEGKGYLPVLVEGLSQSAIDRFAPNMEELEKDVHKDIAKLRKYTEGQNYPSFDDSFYRSYLRVTKYNYKKAKQKLKLYCHMRAEKLTDFYNTYLDTDVIRTILEKNMLGLLPYRDENGNTILYTRGDAWSDEICDFEYFVLTFILVADMIMRIPLTSITGGKYIADVSVNHYSDYYVFQKNLASYHSVVKAMAIRYTQINVVKDTTLCRHLYYLIRPLLPKKLTQRVEMHGDNLQSLHSCINPEILPSEYGGTLGQLDNKFFIDKLMEFIETFKEEQLIFDNASKNKTN